MGVLSNQLAQFRPIKEIVEKEEVYNGEALPQDILEMDFHSIFTDGNHRVSHIYSRNPLSNKWEGDYNNLRFCLLTENLFAPSTESNALRYLPLDEIRITLRENLGDGGCQFAVFFDCPYDKNFIMAKRVRNIAHDCPAIEITLQQTTLHIPSPGVLNLEVDDRNEVGVGLVNEENGGLYERSNGKLGFAVAQKMTMGELKSQDPFLYSHYLTHRLWFTALPYKTMVIGQLSNESLIEKHLSKFFWYSAEKELVTSWTSATGVYITKDQIVIKEITQTDEGEQPTILPVSQAMAEPME